jgi:hypothetical protein
VITTSQGVVVLPGDFAAVRMHDDTSTLIELGEWACEYQLPWKRPLVNYEHAITFVGGAGDLILEAEPGGAKVVPMHYHPDDCLWSSGTPDLALRPSQRHDIPKLARELAGTPYSALDYFAIAAHRLHMNDKRLRNYIAASGHQICSQMVDYLRYLNGFELFSDGRWFGYVKPSDIALRIEQAIASARNEP